MKPNLRFLLKPQNAFLLIASLFGVLFLFLTPPFQSPDENRHFYRAYHISQGSFFATKMDGRVGGYLPKKVKQSMDPYSSMRGRTEQKTRRKQIVHSIFATGDQTLEFVDFPSMAVYTPVSYLPQAFGIRLARLFTDSPIMMLYAGRIMSLICWILAVFLSIRITPILKWLFFALALLPMSIYIHASLSADTITNALVFLLLATFLKHTFSDQFQTKKAFLTVVILVLLLASAKFLYSPLILLFLLIPLKNFVNQKQRIFRFLALIFLAVLVTVCWPIIQGVGYVTYAEYNPNFSEKVNLMDCANIQQQLAYIFDHGAYIFEVLANSFVESFDVFAIGFIGNFGWGELPLPTFWLIFAYVGLVIIALNDGQSKYRIGRYQRLTFLIPFLTIFALVIISQLLIWTCVGAEFVTNLQGRYFIPIAPLLFFMFYRSTEKYKKFLPSGAIVFSSVLLIVSTILIYNRFYVPLEYSTETVICDHEKGGGSADFKTSNPHIIAQNGYSKSREKSRSGSYSSKLSPTVQYGTLITLEGCRTGDRITFEAWRNGPNGMLIIATEGGKRLYESSDEVENTPGEWKKMTFSMLVPPNFENENISCCLAYLSPTDSCYFDDVNISLSRVK